MFSRYWMILSWFSYKTLLFYNQFFWIILNSSILNNKINILIEKYLFFLRFKIAHDGPGQFKFTQDGFFDSKITKWIIKWTVINNFDQSSLLIEKREKYDKENTIIVLCMYT